MSFKKVWLVALIGILLVASVAAQNYPGYEPRGFFSNYSDNEDWGLEQKLRMIESETTAEFAIVLVKNAGEDSAIYATNLFNSWGIGKDCGNGLLILVSTETRQLVILPGPAILVCDEEIKEMSEKSLYFLKEESRMGQGFHELSDKFYAKVHFGQRGQRSPSARGIFGGGQTNRQPIILSY